MAWLVGDGFDFYTASADITVAGSVWTTTVAPGLSATTRFSAGQSTTYTFNAGAGTGSDLTSVTFANSTTIWVNFSHMTSTALVVGNVVCLRVEIRDGASIQCSLALIEDGSYALLDSTGAIIAGTRSAASSFTTNVWNQVQAKVLIDPSAGTFELRINGNTPALVTATGLNTRNTANSYCTDVKIHSVANALGTIFVDDFYAFNSLGVQPNTWQGDVRSVQMMPNSDSSIQWTPNSGVLNYNRVNELKQDTDTTYVSDTTPGHVDQYGLAALGVNPLNIVGAQLKMFARMDDSGPHTVSSRLTSNGTTADSVSTNLTTNYQWIQTMYTADPHTNSTWAVANLNASTIGPVNIL